MRAECVDQACFSIVRLVHRHNGTRIMILTHTPSLSCQHQSSQTPVQHLDANRPSSAVAHPRPSPQAQRAQYHPKPSQNNERLLTTQTCCKRYVSEDGTTRGLGVKQPPSTKRTYLSRMPGDRQSKVVATPSRWTSLLIRSLREKLFFYMAS